MTELLIAAIIAFAIIWYGTRPERRRRKQELIDRKLQYTIDQAWAALEAGDRLVYDNPITKDPCNRPLRTTPHWVIEERAKLRAQGISDEYLDQHLPLNRAA